MYFQLDPDLADAHYFEYYETTNRSMLLCAPNFPMREDIRRYVISKRYSLLMCFYYELGMLELWYNVGDWSYIWSTFGGWPLVISLLAAALITILGLFGK